MANTLKFGNGQWATGNGTALAYNDENANFKPLPFDFTRASSGTVVNQSGLIETVDSGIPRIDFQGNTKGALLLEPSRSNIFDYSSNLSAWNKLNSTVTESSVLSLDGVNNSYVYERTSSSSSYIYRTVSLSNTTVYTLSFFAKSGTSTNVRTDIWDTVQSTQCSIQVDLVTKSVSNFIGTSYKIEDYTNGWMRISVTFTSESSFGTTFNRYFNDDSVGSELYIWGAQVEAGSYPTSYIPTSGSAVTRVADNMPTHLNINPLNIGNSYTLFLDTDLNNVENNRVFSEIENSASSDVFTIRNVIGGIRVYNNLDGQYPTNALQSSTNKWAIRIDGTSYKIFGANSSLSGSLPTARDIGEIKFYGNLTELKINNFNIYNTALSDAECESLVN